MQVISVERWTFWGTVVVIFVGYLASGILFGSPAAVATAPSWQFLSVVGAVAFLLLLVSVALGGSRDPAVRSLPPRAES